MKCPWQVAEGAVEVRNAWRLPRNGTAVRHGTRRAAQQRARRHQQGKHGGHSEVRPWRGSEPWYKSQREGKKVVVAAPRRACNGVKRAQGGYMSGTVERRWVGVVK